jgi:16S rRNA (uracil1498-N3)-methyltransferase
VSPPRFHVPAAAPGARVALPDHSAHHAREVLRLRAGAAVSVFDGVGREFDAVLEEVSRRTVSARLGSRVAARAESPLFLVLALSPLKGDRMELALQKATELGVAEIWPVVTLRTDAAARPALGGSRAERWERVVSGAAEQCGRAVVPRVAATTTLDELLRRPFDGVRLALLETSGHPPLPSLALGATRSLLLLVGPAGGFEPREAERLGAAGFLAASLGPRILRAETAAVAGLAIAQAVWGDLSGSSRRAPGEP